MAARKPVVKKSRWDELRDEAKKDYVAKPPYLLDAYTPPIEISAPDGLERSLALAKLTDTRGSVAVQDLTPMIAALVGDEAYPAVWHLIKDEPVDVALALIRDINDHFNDGADDGADELPGGELDS